MQRAKSTKGIVIQRSHRHVLGGARHDAMVVTCIERAAVPLKPDRPREARQPHHLAVVVTGRRPKQSGEVSVEPQHPRIQRQLEAIPAQLEALDSVERVTCRRKIHRRRIRRKRQVTVEQHSQLVPKGQRRRRIGARLVQSVRGGAHVGQYGLVRDAPARRKGRRVEAEVVYELECRHLSHPWNGRASASTRNVQAARGRGCRLRLSADQSAVGVEVGELCQWQWVVAQTDDEMRTRNARFASPECAEVHSFLGKWADIVNFAHSSHNISLSTECIVAHSSHVQAIRNNRQQHGAHVCPLPVALPGISRTKRPHTLHSLAIYRGVFAVKCMHKLFHFHVRYAHSLRLPEGIELVNQNGLAPHAFNQLICSEFAV
eukprot:Opistho-2@30251